MAMERHHPVALVKVMEVSRPVLETCAFLQVNLELMKSYRQISYSIMRKVFV